MPRRPSDATFGADAELLPSTAMMASPLLYLALIGLFVVGLLFPQGLSAESAEATTPRGSMEGVWLTKGGQSHVAIDSCNSGLCGEIVWLKPLEEGAAGPLLDRNNSDPALRDRPLLGLQIMSGFEPVGANQWGEGEIYNPEDGRTYEPTFTLHEDGQLEVEACVLFICQSQVWQRVE